MKDLGYERLEDGRYQCDICIFATPHENRIQRHMVKSHGRATYPEPPVLAEKWRPHGSEGSVASGSAVGGDVRAQTKPKAKKKTAVKGAGSVSQEVKDA